MRRKNQLRRISNWFALFCAAYLGLAYFAAPAFWTWRDRGVNQGQIEMVTRTPQGIAGDPINIGLIGTRQQVIHAFGVTQWDTADSVTLKTALEIGESVLFDRPYPDAPVSELLFNGRAQDLSFEKTTGSSADKRHHVRLWMSEKRNEDERPIWLGAASFDQGVGISHDTGAITHHIGPDIDAERDLIMRDLSQASLLVSVEEIEGIGPTRDGRNGEGDTYDTDGKVKIAILKP